MQQSLEKFYAFLSFSSVFYEISIDFDEVSKCKHCHLLLLMSQITNAMNVATAVMQLISPYHMAYNRNFLHVIFLLALSEIKLQSVYVRCQSRKTLILIYVLWLELCTYTLIPYVMEPHEVDIYLCGVNKINTWGRPWMLFAVLTTLWWTREIQLSSGWCAALHCHSNPLKSAHGPFQGTSRNCFMGTTLNFCFHPVFFPLLWSQQYKFGYTTEQSW